MRNRRIISGGQAEVGEGSVGVAEGADSTPHHGEERNQDQGRDEARRDGDGGVFGDPQGYRREKEDEAEDQERDPNSEREPDAWSFRQ